MNSAAAGSCASSDSTSGEIRVPAQASRETPRAQRHRAPGRPGRSARYRRRAQASRRRSSPSRTLGPATISEPPIALHGFTDTSTPRRAGGVNLRVVQQRRMPATSLILWPRRSFLPSSSVQFNTTLIRVGCRLRLIAGLEHQEVPTIRETASAGTPRRAQHVRPSKSFRGLPAVKAELSRDVHGHHLVPAAVEQLPPVAIPHRLRAAVGRDLMLRARGGIGLHVRLIAARFVRLIGEPATVGRKTVARTRWPVFGGKAAPCHRWSPAPRCHIPWWD